MKRRILAFVMTLALMFSLIPAVLAADAPATLSATA